MALMGMKVASACWPRNRFSSGLASAIKSAFAFAIQIKLSLVIDSLRMEGIDLTFSFTAVAVHVLVVGHAGLVVGLVHVDRLHDDAYGEEGGRLRDAGIGINAFLSVFINSVRRNKRFSLGIFLHISIVYGPYVEPNERVVQQQLGNSLMTSSNL